jgi:putative hydrolase
MKIIADTHVHTIASEHACSTLMENLREAKAKGLRFLAVTDHTGLMPGAPTDTYFICLRGTIPEEYDGVYLLRGCEVNILDEKGTLDLPEHVLDQLDWVIASVHGVLTKPMTLEQSTQLWLNVAKNPKVDVIGHCGDANFRFDFERVIPEFAKYGKIVEINAGSYRTRPSCIPNCIEIARLCAKYGVPLVLSSDAHFAGRVGDVADAMRIVKEANVPEELILNADFDRFAERLSKRTNRTFVL